MSPETDLNVILAGLNPSVRQGAFVFVTSDRELPAHARVVEREGATLVMEREEADLAGLAYEGVFAWITLEVESSLTAVGLTAAVSTALADAQIPCNVLAGFHHDHLLIPVDQLAEAMAVLGRLKKPKSRFERVLAALGINE